MQQQVPHIWAEPAVSQLGLKERGARRGEGGEREHLTPSLQGGMVGSSPSELPKPPLPKTCTTCPPPAHPSPGRASAQALTFCTRFRAALKWATILSTAVLTAISRAVGQGKGRWQQGSGRWPGLTATAAGRSGSGWTRSPGGAGEEWAGTGYGSIPGRCHGDP